VWKSTVTPKGTAISSVLAYLFPIEPDDLSTLCASEKFFNPAEMVEIKGSNSGLFEIGRTEHLYGATSGGIVKNLLSTSFSRQS